jgi:hypothetical protein
MAVHLLPFRLLAGGCFHERYVTLIPLSQLLISVLAHLERVRGEILPKAIEDLRVGLEEGFGSLVVVEIRKKFLGGIKIKINYSSEKALISLIYGENAC